MKRKRMLHPIYTRFPQLLKLNRVCGGRCWQKQILHIFLYAALILGIIGFLSQIFLLSWKFQIFPRRTNIDDDLSNVTDSTEKPKPKPFLSYKQNFSFPLEIDIAYYVNEKIQFNDSIPYQPINPHPFKYINLPRACDFRLNGTDLTQNDTILVLVKSTASHYSLRGAIRSLWKSVQDAGIKKVFLLGYDGMNQTEINKESQTNRDIIQEDFVDAYRNNTFKTIMGFNWASQFCTEAKFMFFMDDDYYVKLSELANYLRKIPEQNSHNIYIGSLSKKGVPYRDKDTRWYVSAEEYPFDLYPPYIGGGAFVVSYDVAQRFRLAFPFTKYMPIDDAYLGIVARKLNIVPRLDKKFLSYYRGAIARECSHDASELMKQICPLARIGFNMYVHRNKKSIGKMTLLRALTISICILFGACVCVLFPVILHLYCDNFFVTDIKTQQNPSRKC
ncbi:lactosylceramide 1,3-N-acetyl-beta-D-glucosaminyltransferase-like [Mizuhopecten yessoensis]|uniref:lactosylceramide 1,3-N-acetyl-beta-D-glucosaminyltransferase-like n=1 Tax=Mizuhopecten yessoensis TaxID=6573 RepID=UPI000B45C029|nr:lactosylceramide 1,3-N-acetyl-beta-D-glucosaminyltransferase-like [Mizuhopecten yessoensis]